jgi:hypothetical protein
MRIPVAKIGEFALLVFCNIKQEQELTSYNNSSPLQMTIAFECESLKEAWVDFTEASQDKQSTMFTKKANPLNWWDNITIDDLRSSVRSTAEMLDNSHGKTRHYFDKFCNSLNSHSIIFEFLPNQNQYLSIFCGAVKTLLKVV